MCVLSQRLFFLFPPSLSRCVSVVVEDYCKANKKKIVCACAFGYMSTVSEVHVLGWLVVWFFLKKKDFLFCLSATTHTHTRASIINFLTLFFCFVVGEEKRDKKKTKKKELTSVSTPWSAPGHVKVTNS